MQVRLIHAGARRLIHARALRFAFVGKWSLTIQFGRLEVRKSLLGYCLLYVRTYA